MEEDKVDCLVWIVFESCYTNCLYGQNLGVAFEAREASRVREVMDCACSDQELPPTKAQAALRYDLDTSMILEEALTVTAPGGYAEGGSLYPLGLIHRSCTGLSSENKGEDWEFLRGHLQASHANKVVSHWAALGVELADLGSADLGILNDLKELIYTDSSIS